MKSISLSDKKLHSYLQNLATKKQSKKFPLIKIFFIKQPEVVEFH